MVTRYNNHCHQSRLVSPHTFDPVCAAQLAASTIEWKRVLPLVSSKKKITKSRYEGPIIVPRRKRIGQLASNVQDVLTVRLAKEEIAPANASMKCPVLSLSGLSSLMQLRGAAWWEKHIAFHSCRNIRVYSTYTTTCVEPKGLNYNTRLLKGDTCLREFRFQILSRPVKVLYARDGQLLLLPQISRKWEASNRECTLSSRCHFLTLRFYRNYRLFSAPSWV